MNQKKKSVLFLAFAFPNMNSSFNLYTALVDQFHKNGHDITVLAPDPSISRTEVRLEGGIEVIRVKTLPIKNVSNIKKGISNLLLPYQYWFALNKWAKNKSFEIVIMPTPPITLGSLAIKIKRKFNSKLYLILRDIFPQNAVDLGFMKKQSVLYKMFRKKEVELYKEADLMGCMSPRNINYILDHNPFVDKRKLHELKNWQYLYQTEGIDHGIIRKKYEIEDKFVIVFGGNMGKPQQLENVLELVKRCKVYTDVLFLLLGEGVAMNQLRQKIEDEGLNNVRINKSIPKAEYQNLLKVCDLGLISLHKDFTIPNIPSKTLDYFNVGIPVLASIDKSTDYNDVLEEANAGKWVYAGDHEGFFERFSELYNSEKLRKELGRNGREYFEKFLQPEQAYDIVYNVTHNS